uniref:Uncharacterized protein n=1 Tax=Parascaris univalens TaxID=6257 RepID=A0A915BE23_PARUN
MNGIIGGQKISKFISIYVQQCLLKEQFRFSLRRVGNDKRRSVLSAVMSMQLLAFIALTSVGLHYAASQTLDDYVAQGPCVAMPDGSQQCPTNYTCFAEQCYLATLPCLSLSGSLVCPSGMVCIGAATTTGNACIVLEPSQATTASVPSNTGTSVPSFPPPPGPPGPPVFPGPPGPPGPPMPPRPCGHHKNCHHMGHH